MRSLLLGLALTLGLGVAAPSEDVQAAKPAKVEKGMVLYGSVDPGGH